MLTSAEDWFHVDFQAGLNPQLECIRLNLDPVQAYHRPLLVYIILYLTTTIFNIVFLQLIWGFNYSADDDMLTTAPGVVWGGTLGRIHDGFNSTKTFLFTNTTTVPVHDNDEDKVVKLKNIAYFYRNSNNKKTPIVFIHGIGIGVICYAEFIHQLSKSILVDDRPIFLVELPYVSMHMVDYVPTASETVHEIQIMLNSFGYDKAVFVSHSLGTGVSSWVMNFSPDLIAGLVMIDPICFLLHYHHVAFNFVHRIPKTLLEVSISSL
jgi:pimeloyl-ACP methyl ester carboxylesterase